MRPEETLHFSLCDYMRLQYPHVMFISEASGIRVSRGLAQKLKRARSNHVHLDLYVIHPVHPYAGLIIELKAKNIFKKDGTLLKNDHFEDQAKTILRLRKLGYAAGFVCGFDEGKKIIDTYLNGDYKS